MKALISSTENALFLQPNSTLSRFLCTSAKKDPIFQHLPTSESFVSYIEICPDIKSLRKLHACIITSGLEPHIFLGSKLLNSCVETCTNWNQMTSNQPPLPPFEEAIEATADWSPEQEVFFIGIMKEVVISRGNSRVVGKFSKYEWVAMMKKYYTKWGLKYTLKAFKNKHHQLRERFKEFKKLIEETSGQGWHPTLVTLGASDSWWDEYIKTHPSMKHLKRLRCQGCPEFRDLEVIFGDTIATGHLQASSNHNFDSTDEESNQHEGTAESPMVPNIVGINDHDMNERSNQSTQSKSQTRCRKRARRDDRGAELPEAVMMLAEASRARAEMRGKFTISECIDVLDTMDMVIDRPTYAKVLKLLHDKSWREAFLHLSDARRKELVKSVEDGIL